MNVRRFVYITRAADKPIGAAPHHGRNNATSALALIELFDLGILMAMLKTTFNFRGFRQLIKQPSGVIFSVTPSVDPSLVFIITGHLSSALGYPRLSADINHLFPLQDQFSY